MRLDKKDLPKVQFKVKEEDKSNINTERSSHTCSHDGEMKELLTTESDI